MRAETTSCVNIPSNGFSPNFDDAWNDVICLPNILKLANSLKSSSFTGVVTN